MQRVHYTWLLGGLFCTGLERMVLVCSMLVPRLLCMHHNGAMLFASGNYSSFAAAELARNGNISLLARLLLKVTAST